MNDSESPFARRTVDPGEGRKRLTACLQSVSQEEIYGVDAAVRRRQGREEPERKTERCYSFDEFSAI